MQARPVNRVFGSKARVAGAIISLIPPRTRVWVEVFAGSAAVTLAKPPHRSEHINDFDGDVFNLFSVLRDQGQRQQLVDAVMATPWAQLEYEACAGVGDVDPVERARRYLVRSWQGVASKVASPSGWAYDVSANKVRPRMWSEMPDRITIAAERLKQVHVHSRDGREIVRTFGGHRNACLFLDPPYPHASIHAYPVLTHRD